MIALGLLLLDVAIRRLWIDKKQMQSMFAPVGQVTTGSVDALRKIHKASTQDKQSIEPQELQIKKSSKKQATKEKPTVKEKKAVEDRDDNLGRLLKKKRDRGDQGDSE
jgi:hypothetical protein